MESVRGIADRHADRRGHGVEWRHPGALIYAWSAFPKPLRALLPQFKRLAFNTDAWRESETQVLARAEVAELLEELRLVRRICARLEFLPGVDGARVHAVWRGQDDPAEFETDLDEIERFLERIACEDDLFLHIGI
jgi:hypothetical protein